jgi:hypothetical protein
MVHRKSRAWLCGVTGRLFSTLTALPSIFGLAGTAFAQAMSRPPPFAIDEARIGVYDHNVEPHGSEAGVHVKGEHLFGRIPGAHGDSIFDTILRPRPHVGGNLKFNATPASPISGLTWDYPLSPNFVLEASFSGAVHDGPLCDRPQLAGVVVVGAYVQRGSVRS